MPRRHEMLETDECFTACGFMVTWSISHISFIFPQILFKSIKKINKHYYFYCNWSAALLSHWDAIVFRVCAHVMRGSQSWVCHKKLRKRSGSSWWLGGKVLLVARCLCGQCRMSHRQLCAGKIWRSNSEELYPDVALTAEVRCVQCWVLTKTGTVLRGGKCTWIIHLPVFGDWEASIWQGSKPPSRQKCPEIRRCSFQEML